MLLELTAICRECANAQRSLLSREDFLKNTMGESGNITRIISFTDSGIMNSLHMQYFNNSY